MGRLDHGVGYAVAVQGKMTRAAIFVKLGRVDVRACVALVNVFWPICALSTSAAHAKTT